MKRSLSRSGKTKRKEKRKIQKVEGGYHGEEKARLQQSFPSAGRVVQNEEDELEGCLSR